MGVNKININNNDSNYAHSIFDISEYTGKTYDTLSDALADVPDGKKKGGMTVAFVQDSESDNKYVQFRLMSDTFNTTPANWQGVDDEPTISSKNLITSGGVKAKIDAIGIIEATTEHDFAIGDENGNNIIVFEGGDFETKNFNSRTVREKVFPQINQFSNITYNTFHYYYFPFGSGYTVSIKLENISGNEGVIGFAFRRNNEGNVNYQLKQFRASEIATNLTYKVTANANYDSFVIWYARGTISLIENFYVYGPEIETNIKLDDSVFDLSISDANENKIALFKDGHFRTKNFNSKNRFSNFSILGDSYSTFKEFTTPASNAQWYPTNVPGTQGYNSGNDVIELEQTWWYKFANEYGIRLLENNSYSGSPICYDGYGTGTSDAKTYCFVTREQNLGQAPELILIFGGTNDDWANVGIGAYKYSDWTEDDLVTFRPALAKLFNNLRKNNIGSTVVFILNDGLDSEINTSVDVICSHYNVPLLKLQSISKTANHPNSIGMEQIKEQLIQFLLKF